MPAAPRTIVDAATSVTSIETTAPSLPTLDTSSLPAIDTAPLAAIYHNSVAFAGRIQAVVMPTLPAGLENAKPPTLTERLVPHVQPILALITPTRSAIRNPQSEIEPPPPQPTSVVDGDGWQGIEILKSTRNDVEKILGKPRIGSVARDAATYETKDAEVFVEYSTGNCNATSDGEWNVSELTVVGISVRPKTKRRLEALNLDLSKYEKKPDPGILHLVEYLNRTDGIIVVFDKEEEVVIDIRYYPGRKYDDLRCKR